MRGLKFDRKFCNTTGTDKFRHLNKLENIKVLFWELCQILLLNQNITFKSSIPWHIQIFSKNKTEKSKNFHLLLFIANALWKWEKCKRDSQFLSHVQKRMSQQVSWVGDGVYILLRRKKENWRAKGKTVEEHYLLFCQFLCIFRHCSKNDDEWVVWQMHTQISSLSSPVVAQSYKIDVEILAAPRGT